MPGGMRVFSSKGRTEGVAVSKSNGDSLNIELSTDTEVGWSAEQVFLIVDSLFFKWDGLEVEQVFFSGALGTTLLFLFLLWLFTFGFILCLLLLSSKSVFLFNRLDFFS